MKCWCSIFKTQKSPFQRKQAFKDFFGKNWASSNHMFTEPWWACVSCSELRCHLMLFYPGFQKNVPVGVFFCCCCCCFSCLFVLFFLLCSIGCILLNYFHSPGDSLASKLGCLYCNLWLLVNVKNSYIIHVLLSACFLVIYHLWNKYQESYPACWKTGLPLLQNISAVGCSYSC